MGELARSCARWVMDVFQAHTGASLAMSSEAHALVHEQSFGLGPLDHRVLAERLYVASLHLSSLIAAGLPEGADDASAIAAVAARNRPRIAPAPPRTYLGALTSVGLRHAVKGMRVLERAGVGADSRVLKSMSAARTNLRIARYLAEVRPAPDETLETVLEECREMVRRNGGGDSAAV